VYACIMSKQSEDRAIPLLLVARVQEAQDALRRGGVQRVPDAVEHGGEEGEDADGVQHDGGHRVLAQVEFESNS